MVYADSYKINKDDSFVYFIIDHAVGFSSGFMVDFDGSLDINTKKYSFNGFDLETKSDSLTTYNEKRDAFLKSDNFLNVDSYPVIKIKTLSLDGSVLMAEVSALGKTKKIPFDVNFAGISEDSSGRKTALVTLKGTLNREDFGVMHNVSDEKNKPMLGKDINLLIQLSGVK